MLNKFICFFLILICGSAYGSNAEPIMVNAILTATNISFEPASIPENTPFALHIINKTNVPVELENSDTSVEIYDGTDKTFKIGLAAGRYKFFNDFNPKAGATDLVVLNPEQVSNATVPTQLNASSAATIADTVKSSVNAGSPSLSEIMFIMWRESIEALLVVGIVYSWLKQLKSGRKEGMVFLAAGVAVGVLCAITLGTVLVKLSGVLSGSAQGYLQAGLTLIAAIMIVYMVKWMRSNGAKLKSEMLGNITARHDTQRWNISILVVVAVAIAREGSEAVIFIYALGFGERGVISGSMLGAVVLGLALAVLTIWLLSLGNKIFSWKYFFKVTEVLLLLLGGALLLNCVDLLVAAGVLPVIKAQFWDTSFILGDGGHLTPLLTSIVGYRASPSLIDVIAYISYWIIVLKLIKIQLPLQQKT